MQESLPAYTYNLGHLVRFPNDQDSLQHSKNDPITSDFLSGSTQAISSDSKLTSSTGSPLLVKAVSSNKPFRFKDVYQNPDSSFVNKNQENRNVESVKGQENNYIQYANKGSYQNGHSFGAYFASLPTDHSLTTDSQIINIPGPPAYQNNYLIPEQDLGTSETIKVPVAVIRGTHDITGTEILGLSINK